MNRKVAHYILTRFNMGCNDEAWTMHRLQLWLRYSLPGMAAQTEKSWTWLCGISPWSPKIVTETLGIKHRDVATTFECRTLADFLPWITEDARRRGATHVLTSRLDSDDGLAVDFVERTMAVIEEDGRDELWVDWMNGLWLNDESGAVKSHRNQNSPFVQRLERLQEGETIRGAYEFRHKRIPQENTVHRETEDPMWLAVCHGLNMSNDMRRYPAPEREPAPEELARFGL